MKEIPFTTKSERSKWRFKVKKYYKKLKEIKVNTEDGDKATELLIEIYKTLSYGTNYLMFSNWNTFGAIQVTQSEFLKDIVDRKLFSGISSENLQSCIDLLEAKYDPQEFHKNVFGVIESSLKTTDAKYLAIELLQKKVDKWNEKYNKKQDYDNEVMLNYFVENIVYIYFDLYETDKGIKYFKKQYVCKNKEVKEYILLEMIDEYDFYIEWINEYEKNVGKIPYRESLKEKYKELKKRLKQDES